jgi:hypothetical protein
LPTVPLSREIVIDHLLNSPVFWLTSASFKEYRWTTFCLSKRTTKDFFSPARTGSKPVYYGHILLVSGKMSRHPSYEKR